MCHVSRVTCYVLRVICHIFFLSFFGQSGEAYWLGVCYQRGLPRLVFSLASSLYTSMEYCEINTLLKGKIEDFNLSVPFLGIIDCT